MGTLREKVAEAILDNEWEPMASKEWDELYDREKRRYLEMADDSIAAVFEALLSDAAVEAGAEPIAEMCRPMFDFRPGGHGPSSWMPWDDTPVIEGNAKARTITREQLKAAMSALTADAAQTGGEG